MEPQPSARLCAFGWQDSSVRQFGSADARIQLGAYTR